MPKTSAELLDLLTVGVKAYYDNIVRSSYSFFDLICVLSGASTGLSDLVASLETWTVERDELLTLLQSADLSAIFENFSRESTDEEMIALFEDSIQFSSDEQKYAFLSAINSLPPEA